MWKTARRPRVKECDHEKRVVTITAGIQRSSCERCGHVIMAFAHDTIAGLALDDPASAEPN